MSSSSMHTHLMSSSLRVNSLVENRLFKTASDIEEPPFQFIHTINLSEVDTMLHDSPDLVIHRTEIWAVWRPLLGCKKVSHFLMQQFNCCMCEAQCAGALSCWNTKSLPDTLHIAGNSMTLLWRREAASKKSARDITRISCFVTTMKLLHALQIYSTVFVNKCIVVAFYKVVQQQTISEVGMQQQTIGEIGNSIMHLWADNFCLQQWKNY